MNRNNAVERFKNKEISTVDIMCAFDIIGAEYLGWETSYVNHFDGFCELIGDFELENNEILEFMLENPQYKTSDMFVTFDGENLVSHKDVDYFIYCLEEKMNSECAEYILGV